MLRPVWPEFDRRGEFLIDLSDGYIDFNALLDMAQKDLRECND